MLSVLIVNWNTRDLLDKCLESIFRHAPHDAFEVVVVDNASSDGSAGMVQARFPQVRLLQPNGNLGYALGNNLAFSEGKGDFLLTLNPDTEVVDDSLDRAVSILIANPKAGCLGARLISPDGSTQPSVRGFPSMVGILGDLTGLGKRLGGRLDSYRLSHFDYDEESDAPQPMGTFLLFRRVALEDVGEATAPFDPRFPIFFNEVDLLYRLRQKGWTCVYAPSVRILHHGGESTKLVRKSMIWESHRSLVRFLRKHERSVGARIGTILLTPLVYAAAFVRAKGYDVGFRA